MHLGFGICQISLDVTVGLEYTDTGLVGIVSTRHISNDHSGISDERNVIYILVISLRTIQRCARQLPRVYRVATRNFSPLKYSDIGSGRISMI